MWDLQNLLKYRDCTVVYFLNLCFHFSKSKALASKKFRYWFAANISKTNIFFKYSCFDKYTQCLKM